MIKLSIHHPHGGIRDISKTLIAQREKERERLIRLHSNMLLTIFPLALTKPTIENMNYFI